MDKPKKVRTFAPPKQRNGIVNKSINKKQNPMKAELIKFLFEQNIGKNFIIQTSKMDGHGINGVSSHAYYGERTYDPSSYSSYEYDKTTILGISVENNCILMHNNHAFYKNTIASQIICLDCDCITSIHFLCFDNAVTSSVAMPSVIPYINFNFEDFTKPKKTSKVKRG